MFSLVRFDSCRPDFSSSTKMLKNLKMFLESPFNNKDFDWQRQFLRIVEFQNEDGAFNIMEEGNIPSDAYVDFFKYPTVLCSAIMMKAVLLFPDEYSRFVPNLSKALLAISKMGISGSGYDCMSVTLDFLSVYCDAGLRFFIDKYPDVQPEFTNRIVSIASSLRNDIENKKFIFDFNNDYENEIRSVYRELSQHPIFVYGTLMSGECNHSLIPSQQYKKDGFIRWFNLYNLGSFPGIRPSRYQNRKVYGELYYLDDESLENVNMLEGEGSLYSLKCAEMQFEKKNIIVGVYVFNRKVRKEKRIFTGDWKLPSVYIAYGSNMNSEWMKKRCPDAKFLAVSCIENHSLCFRENRAGNVYSTIEESSDSKVPVVLWAIDSRCESKLDCFEGYDRQDRSSCYYLKRKYKVDFGNEKVNGIVYVMNGVGRKAEPKYDYYNRILRGYIDHQIDPQPLIDALES